MPRVGSSPRAAIIAAAAVLSILLHPGSALPQSAPVQPSAPPAANDSALTLRFGLEYWVRATEIDNFDFDDHRPDALTFGWQRIKPFFGGRKRWFEFALQGQDARSHGVPPFTPNGSPTYTTRTSQLDFIKAFVKVTPRPGLTIKVGREQADGAEIGISRKLASSSNYGTVLKSFDLVSLRWEHRASSLMGFVAAPVDNLPYSLNRRNRSERFWGVQATHTGRRNAHCLYLVDRSFGPLGPPSETGVHSDSATYALGFQETGRLVIPGLAWDAEGMFEWGHRSTDRLRAAALFVTATHTFTPDQNVFASYYQSSGDGTSGDGTTHGFDTLYSSGFNNWGYMGLSRGRNIGELRFGGTSKIAGPVSVMWADHEQFLSVGRDLWYAIFTPNVSRPSAPSSRLGREIDATLLLKFPRLKHATIALGYLEFFPGGYLETTGPHAHPRQFAIDIYGQF